MFVRRSPTRERSVGLNLKFAPRGLLKRIRRAKALKSLAATAFPSECSTAALWQQDWNRHLQRAGARAAAEISPHIGLVLTNASLDFKAHWRGKR